jgi:hypothetical protein
VWSWAASGDRRWKGFSTGVTDCGRMWGGVPGKMWGLSPGLGEPGMGTTGHVVLLWGDGRTENTEAVGVGLGN